MKPATVLRGLTATVIGFFSGILQTRWPLLSDQPTLPQNGSTLPSSVAVSPLLEVTAASTPEKLFKVLIAMSLEDQMEAWDSACKSLLESGRWQDAISLALLAPSIRIEGKAVFPLAWVMKTVAGERPLEAFHWLKNEAAKKEEWAAGGLAALLDSWQIVNREDCLRMVRDQPTENALIRDAVKNLILETLRKDPSLVTSADLQKVFPASADPGTIIRELGQALGASDPSRAIEWAKTLETSTQRSFAVTSALTGAALSDHPNFWKTLENVRDQSSKEYISTVWAESQFQQKAFSAENELSRVPDGSLRSAAANAMVSAASKSNLPEAAALAARLFTSGISADPWTSLITSSGIAPHEWTLGLAETNPQVFGKLSPESQAAIVEAANLLASKK